MSDLVNFLTEISGYCFHNEELGIQAITHSSYAKTHHNPLKDNERLEFLGDAVLEFSVSCYLFLNYPNMREGEMTRSRSWLVREDSLYRAAIRIGLDKLIRIDDAEEKIGGRNKPSILSDAFEALIAAIYLDGGYAAASDFIHRSLLNSLSDEDINPRKDPKTQLQEYVQARNIKSEIKYQLVQAVGPDHKKEFTMAVYIDDQIVGKGTGQSKKAAEEKAAAAALDSISIKQEYK